MRPEKKYRFGSVSAAIWPPREGASAPRVSFERRYFSGQEWKSSNYYEPKDVACLLALCIRLVGELGGETNGGAAARPAAPAPDDDIPF